MAIQRQAGTLPQDHEAQAKVWLVMLLGQLHSLQRYGLVHRDLKPSNLMLSTDSGCLRLIDWDCLARAGKRNRSAGWGTPLYQPPEVLEQLSDVPDTSEDM